MKRVNTKEGGASAPLDLLAPDEAVNAALAECDRRRAELEAGRVDGFGCDRRLEPLYRRLDEAEARMARLKPVTLHGLAASAQWFLAYRDWAPSDAELAAWPETIERAALEMLAKARG